MQWKLWKLSNLDQKLEENKRAQCCRRCLKIQVLLAFQRNNGWTLLFLSELSMACTNLAAISVNSLTIWCQMKSRCLSKWRKCNDSKCKWLKVVGLLHQCLPCDYNAHIKFFNEYKYNKSFFNNLEHFLHFFLKS